MSRDHFTIGHSTRRLEDFVEMLRKGGANFVVDVRAFPRSRTNPRYNRDRLPGDLAPFQIGYEHIAELGGRRGIAADIPEDVNAYWQNRSFHNFADYALSDAFEAGFSRLTELGETRRCAVMCSEAVWWRCHRRIIADYLLHRGQAVFHLMEGGRVQPAKMTIAAVASDSDSAKLVYPLPSRLS
jgi:uncharacterized protein (DUF488 family)